MKNANYALGKVINFAHSGNLPSNVLVNFFVGDKIENNSIVNVYEYKDNKFDLVKKDIQVENGYVELSLEHCSVYFVTPANLNNTVCENNVPVDNSNSLIIVSSLLGLMVLFNIWYFLFRKKNNKTSYNY